MITLLKNGNIDVLIEDGIIRAVGAKITESSAARADKIIDCTGLTVIPGLCDMHVHLRDPGQTHKEDLESGAAAAAAGGVTAIMCMPNTTPAIDTAEAVRDLVERSKGLPVKVYPCAAITKGLEGKELTDFRALKEAGAVAVSDDGNSISDLFLMANAVANAKEAGLAIIAHCEDKRFGNTRISENLITMRDLCIAENLKAPIHIAHVSTTEAVGYVRTSRKRGAGVTCEVTPHHFTLTNEKLKSLDADYKMNPPLRRSDDVNAIYIALKNGTVNCIASDHAPHSADEKADFDTAPPGVVGLETLFAATLTRLYHTDWHYRKDYMSEDDTRPFMPAVPLDKIVEFLCVNPRKILGIPGGVIAEGEPADLAIVDLEENWVVDADRLRSKSKNTCFKGMTLKGRVKYTILNGEVVYNG